MQILLTEVAEDLAVATLGGNGSSSSEACKSSGDESDSAEHREQGVCRNGVANKKVERYAQKHKMKKWMEEEKRGAAGQRSWASSITRGGHTKTHPMKRA